LRENSAESSFWLGEGREGTFWGRETVLHSAAGSEKGLIKAGDRAQLRRTLQNSSLQLPASL